MKTIQINIISSILFIICSICWGYTPPIGIPNPVDFFNGLDPIEVIAPAEPDPWTSDVEGWFYVNNADSG